METTTKKTPEQQTKDDARRMEIIEQVNKLAAEFQEITTESDGDFGLVVSTCNPTGKEDEQCVQGTICGTHPFLTDTYEELKKSILRRKVGRLLGLLEMAAKEEVQKGEKENG